MIKLYKAGDVTRYWEAWNTSTKITIHWGILGETGESREIALSPEDDPNKIILREAKQPRNDGYRKIATSKLQRLVIQYQVQGMGNSEDLKQRERIEHLMNECLGWRGLGFCDGGDIGSGTVNIFCLVVDAKVAVPHVVDELKAKRLIDGAVVAIGAKPKVVWPADFKAKLSI